MQYGTAIDIWCGTCESFKPLSLWDNRLQCCRDCYYPALTSIANAKVALEHHLLRELGYLGPFPDWYVLVLDGTNFIYNPLIGIDERLDILAREYNSR